MSNLPALRRDLAEARIVLRQAKDHYETTKAIALLDASGKNDDERKRLAAATLAQDGDCVAALLAVRAVEAEIERLEAEISIHEDDLRRAELVARERLAEALLGRRTDAAIDDAALERYTNRVLRGEL